MALRGVTLAIYTSHGVLIPSIIEGKTDWTAPNEDKSS
jgi:hypothetical protein